MNLKTLRTIKAIVCNKNRSTLPILDYIHLESDFFYLSDLKITVMARHYFPIPVYPILIDYDIFLQRMSTIKAPFSISSDDKGKAYFKMPDNRASSVPCQNGTDSFIKTLPADGKETPLFNLTGGEIKLLNIALQFTSDDELRPVMNTICMSQDYIVASDAHKLYFRKIHRNKGEKDVMIDKRVAKLMLISGDDFDIKQLSGSFMCASSPDMTIWYWTNQGNNLYNNGAYPNWRSVVPKIDKEKPLNNVTLPVNEMLDAIQAIEFSVNPASRMVRFELKGDHLMLYGHNFDDDIQSSEKINILNPDKAIIEFGFKLDFLRQIFKVFKNEGRYQVSMQFSENNRCFVFADYILLMPMMIHESNNY
jgi:hypothetical protein